MADDKVIDLRAAVEGRIQEEAEKLAGAAAEKDQKSGAGGPDDPRFVLQCLDHNERGDGILYAALHRGKFVYVKSRDEKAKAWFRWEGHHWDIDKGDFHHAAVEDVALCYQREAERLKPEIDDARGDLVAANDRVNAAKKLRKILEKEGTSEEIAACDADGRQAEEDAGRAKASLGKLTRLQKDLYDRVDRLRSLRGTKNAIEYSHKIGRDGLFIYGDEVDQKPMLLPCANGVIDLETGELLDGRPEDYLVRAIPVEYKGINEPCPTWERFFADIHRDDQAVIEFVGRFLGYCLTGKDPEQMYACFIGEGANGKGTMFEILREILGDLSWSINPELLLDSKTVKSPDGPSPAVMSLQGRRLVVASETDDGRKISAANVKKYTGGDTLTGRNLFDKYDTNFRPTHKLVLYTNHAPRGLAADFALFRRLLYIEYQLRYVDDLAYHQKQDPQNAHLYRQKDGNLPEKLRGEKPGILAWLVRHCLKWQAPGDKGGLQIPDSIRAKVEEVRKKEDYLEQFIEAICQRTHLEDGGHWCISFKTLYDRFAKWYSEEHGSGKDKHAEESGLIKKRKFGEQLRKKGYLLPPPAKTSGKQYVAGLTFDGAPYDERLVWRQETEGGPGL